MAIRFLLLITIFFNFTFCTKKESIKDISTVIVPPSSNNNNNSNFPIDAVTPIYQSIVKDCFRGTGLKNIHPRLLFNASDIEQIKSNAITDPFAKGTYDGILTKANSLLTSPLLTYGLDAAGLRITNIHTFVNDQLPYLVLAYQFTKDIKYAKRCWDQLELMTNFPDWGANRHFLDAGIAAKGIAIAYDGLYDYLTVSQRLLLYNAVKANVLQPGKSQIETNTGVFKWYLTNDNWNGICHGGMIMASLATYEQDSSFNSSVISLAANGIEKYINSLEPDGASEEGLSYWDYGLSNTILAFESMKRCLTSTFGLTSKNGFKKTGWFPYNMSGPVATTSIGDDYLYNGKAYKLTSYFWYGNFFNDANFAKTHYDACNTINANKTDKMHGWIDLLYYNKSLIDKGSGFTFPLNGNYAGVDYMYISENNTENAMYIGMHGGDNNASHGHLDAGSFYMQSLGEIWAAGNLGRENNYQSDYFNLTAPIYNDGPTKTANTIGRFYYYRIRSEGKNCLIINPDARPEQNPNGKATLIKESNDNSVGYYIIDLTSNYSRDVTYYKRGIKLNRAKAVMTVQDEFAPINKNSTIYWIMHSPATDGLSISIDGKVATLSKNGKKYFARILSPTEATFSLTNRSTNSINYLSETKDIFSQSMLNKNGFNIYYGKLEIKLTNVSNSTNISVSFSANNLNENILKPLESWTSSN